VFSNVLSFAVIIAVRGDDPPPMRGDNPRVYLLEITPTSSRIESGVRFVPFCKKYPQPRRSVRVRTPPCGSVRVRSRPIWVSARFHIFFRG